MIYFIIDDAQLGDWVNVGECTKDGCTQTRHCEPGTTEKCDKYELTRIVSCEDAGRPSSDCAPGK